MDEDATPVEAYDAFASLRARMVREQVEARGVRDERVLRAMGRVPRERFVPEESRADAYEDRALPLPHGQAISQPYVVAAMTEALGLGLGPFGTDEIDDGTQLRVPFVLEVGTGSGYQAAVLLAMGARVLTVERIPELSAAAARRLAECPGLDPENPVRAGPAPGRLTCLTGDGVDVAGEHGTFDSGFDGILVTAAADEVPPPLLTALRPGARLVIPVSRKPGRPEGRLRVCTRSSGGYEQRDLFEVRFVPLRPGVEGAGGGSESCG